MAHLLAADSVRSACKSRHLRRRSLALGLAAAAGLLTVGCSSGAAAKQSDSTTSSSKPALFAELPADIQKSGVLRNGADFTYAPLEYMEPDGKTYTGVDYDLAVAVANKLGVKLENTNAAFGTLIPSLQSHRIDMVFSFATVTQEREQTVDFIQYSHSGTALLVKKDNPDAITSLDSLCGKKVGLQAGAVQVPIAQAASATCVKEGKSAITINQLGKDSEVQLLLRSGRISADLLDAPVAAYAATIDDQVEVVPNARYEVRPHGIMVLKGNDQLRDVLLKAVQAVIADGTYERVLAKYKVPDLAISAPQINGATS